MYSFLLEDINRYEDNDFETDNENMDELDFDYDYELEEYETMGKCLWNEYTECNNEYCCCCNKNRDELPF